MADSKILEDDKDEWFYNSLKRYTNLYMFDLECPVDAMRIIDHTSICVSGIQNYSKKCEILQLSVPTKLLPKHIEDGLCKDRDFKILSGGYSTHRITQIEPLSSFPNFLTTVQNGYGGCTVFKLGDDEHGVIQQDAVLSSTDLAKTTTTCMSTWNDQIVVNSTTESIAGENVVYEWKLGTNIMSSSLPTRHSLSSNVADVGNISKLKYWNENVIVFCSTKGFVSMFDLRDRKPSLMFSTVPSNITTSLLYSFDCIPSANKIGSIDSCGGYFSIDVRNLKENNMDSRQLLPIDMKNVSAVIGNKFDIEYESNPNVELGTKFVVVGMKQDVIPVFIEQPQSKEITCVFTHDGHTKTVTHVSWHTLTENLLFSTSVDSVLHAWQYVGQ